MSGLVENWRPIESAPGYEVSDLGRVRSWRKSGRSDTPHANQRRYLEKRAVAC